MRRIAGSCEMKHPTPEKFRQLKGMLPKDHHYAELYADWLKQAAKNAQNMWADCRGEDYEGRRGADVCQFEGTHICYLCQLADARNKITKQAEELAKMKAENEQLRDPDIAQKRSIN